MNKVSIEIVSMVWCQPQVLNPICFSQLGAEAKQTWILTPRFYLYFSILNLYCCIILAGPESQSDPVSQSEQCLKK